MPSQLAANPPLAAAIVALERAIAAAGHGEKAALYAECATKWQISVPTVKRFVQEVGGRKRKVRTDAGDSACALEELRAISGAMTGTYRANDKKILALKDAVAMLRRDGVINCWSVDKTTGEMRFLSISSIATALRKAGLHPAQLRQAKPAVRLSSRHPNHVWQIDASISVLYYVPEAGGMGEMSPTEFNKNKPANFEKIKRERLTRYAITDHASGEIFVTYVPGGESVENMAEALIRCMVKRNEHGMFGVPHILMTDPGSAPKSGTMGNLLRRLQIELVINQSGNARAKGQVENAHNLIETSFESGFKFQTIPDLAWVNEKAAIWMQGYNCQQTHSRHGQPRHEVWRTIRQEELRIIDEATARAMLTEKPKPCRVDDFLEVAFKGRRYSAKDIPGVMVGEKLDIARNPFADGKAWVVALAPDGSELLTEIPEIVTSQYGFAADARVIGEGYEALPDTTADKHRKEIQRLIYNAPTDKAADKAARDKTPLFAGRIDPYRRFADLPAAIPLPRRGTALDVATEVAATEKRLNHFEAARAMVALGLAMDARKNSYVREWYPDGVLESEVPALADKLERLTALRVVGGGY